MIAPIMTTIRINRRVNRDREDEEADRSCAVDPLGVAGVEANGSNPMPRAWIGRLGYAEPACVRGHNLSPLPSNVPLPELFHHHQRVQIDAIDAEGARHHAVRLEAELPVKLAGTWIVDCDI
jgi:hypothetical protein